MQENAIYSVITPEGCAAILWRDAGEAKKAAAAFKPDALHCLELGVVDGIVPEPPGGAQTDHDDAARLLKLALVEALAELEDVPPDELRTKRRAKFRGLGVFAGPLALSLLREVSETDVETSRVVHSVHRVFNVSLNAPGPALGGPRTTSPRQMEELAAVLTGVKVGKPRFPRGSRGKQRRWRS